jgi:hypothetical protein
MKTPVQKEAILNCFYGLTVVPGFKQLSALSTVPPPGSLPINERDCACVFLKMLALPSLRMTTNHLSPKGMALGLFKGLL